MTDEALAIADLEREVALRDAMLAERDGTIAARDAALLGERQEIKRLQLMIDRLRHMIFGRRSEQVAKGQTTFLGEAVEASAPGDAPADEATHETGPEKRKRRAGGRKPLPLDLPRERVVYEVPEAERVCSCCGEAMRSFAEDVTEELEMVPAKLFVREHVRPKYSCAACAEGVVQASLPARPIEKGRPGPGLLSHVVVSKFVDHLPLYRQAGMFARHGVDLPRSTLCDYVAACAEELDPVVQEIRKAVRASRIVQADETRLLVLEQHDGKRRRECWLWAYRASSGETVFDFRETRSRDGPREFLAGFQGHLQCDGYAGYGDLGPGVVLVGCWAHARRKFFDSQTSAATDSKEALDLVGKLYAIEAEATHLDPGSRAALRREKARPVLLGLEARLEEWSMSALPRSEFGQAVAYARSQWPKLVRYLDDGGLEVDNNAAYAARGIDAVMPRPGLCRAAEPAAVVAASSVALVERRRGIIRGSGGRPAARPWGGSGEAAARRESRARAPALSVACPRAGRSAWSRPTRDRARARSACRRRPRAAWTSPLCGGGCEA